MVLCVTKGSKPWGRTGSGSSQKCWIVPIPVSKPTVLSGITTGISVPLASWKANAHSSKLLALAQESFSPLKSAPAVTQSAPMNEDKRQKTPSLVFILRPSRNVQTLTEIHFL